MYLFCRITYLWLFSIFLYLFLSVFFSFCNFINLIICWIYYYLLTLLISSITFYIFILYKYSIIFISFLYKYFIIFISFHFYFRLEIAINNFLNRLEFADHHIEHHFSSVADNIDAMKVRTQNVTICAYHTSNFTYLKWFLYALKIQE